MALLVRVGDTVYVLGANVVVLILMLAIVGVVFIIGEYGPWKDA